MDLAVYGNGFEAGYLRVNFFAIFKYKNKCQ